MPALPITKEEIYDYKVPRVVKFINTENRTVAAKGWGVRGTGS